MRPASLSRSLVPALLVLAAAAACDKDKDNAPEPPAAAPSGESAPVAPTAAAPSAKPASGFSFSPKTNGFKFENYGNDKGYENLTPAELRRMFGDKVCGDLEADGSCVLAPPAAAWMQEQNNGMSGGHCEGFAALSLLMDLGKVKPKDFGADTAFGLEIDHNAKLQHEIAYWFVTQAVAPMSSAEIKTLTPKDVVDKLAAAFKAGGETYTLGIYQPDGSEGHATTAYGVVDKGSGISWILHYDNNYPGEEKHIVVDRNANTWQYFTASNPNEEGMEYKGDAATFSLTIAPTSVRISPMQCPFCGDVGPDAAPGGNPQLYLDGAADLLVADEAGHHLGHLNGKIVNDLPGGSYQNTRSVLASHHEPIYTLPSGHKLTVTLDGSVLSKVDDANVDLIGPGYTMGVYDINLQPHEKDTITFSPDWSEITYATPSSETPRIELGIETPGPDYMFTFKVTGEADGQQIDLHIDVKGQRIALQVHGKAGTTQYSVDVQRIDKGGTQEFTHKGLTVGSSDQLWFDYGAWKGNHQKMEIEHDANHDGKADKTEEIGDEQ